jgi:hypothetical protein
MTNVEVCGEVCGDGYVVVDWCDGGSDDGMADGCS